MCMNFAYLIEIFFKKYEPTLFYAWLYKMSLQRNIFKKKYGNYFGHSELKTNAHGHA